MEVLTAEPGDRLDVLVVDDDPAGLDGLTAGLKRAGLVCAGARTGWEALETLLRGTIPYVMITDIRMPELDGLELAHRLKRLGAVRLPEIVFISGSAELDHAVEAIRLRARDLLTKPIDLRRLIQIVREVRLEREAPSSWMEKPTRRTTQVDGAVEGRFQPKTIDVGAMSSVVLNHLRKLRRVCGENLPPGMTVEASWEILLDLYVSERQGERISLTALGGSAGVPLTSALRRIHELERNGMISRIPDPTDKRRVAALLTEKGREAVQTFIRSYANSHGDAGTPMSFEERIWPG
ncbi:response regulator [Reyranella sp.]|uniref:response regulator n=1 Tax=Reyranella sp. TaxID=1929291 RepID=UPI003BABCF51